jgi:hypothetical protein
LGLSKRARRRYNNTTRTKQRLSNDTGRLVTAVTRSARPEEDNDRGVGQRAPFRNGILISGLANDLLVGRVALTAIAGIDQRVTARRHAPLTLAISWA